MPSQSLSRLLFLLLLLVVAAWAATNSSVSSTPWKPCPWSVDSNTARYFIIDCATVQVPLDYARPRGERIGHHVTRVRQRDQSTPVVQLWILNGGPGTPGEWFLQELANPAAVVQLPFPVEFLLPDHRGTGLSSELACPDGSQNLTRACVAAVAADRRIRHFTISNAARDLYESLAVLRGNAPVFFLGTSYGSLHLNRFLTIFPDAPIAGAILDSLVDPTFPHFFLYDVEATEVGDEFLWRVSSGTLACAALWRTQPAVVAAHQLLHKIAAGQERCIAKHFPYLNGQVGAARLKNYVFLSSVLEALNYYSRLVLPAVIYRLRRCQPYDVQALGTYFAMIPELRGGSSPPSLLMPSFVRQSMVLNALIHLSENFDPFGRIPSPEVLDALEPKLTFATAAPVRVSRLYHQGFPTYPSDRYHGILSNPSVPVMVLNGDLDAATLVGYVSKLVRRRPNWYFRPLPNVGHSPFSMVMFGDTCIARAFISFLTQPTVDPFLNWNCEPKLPRVLDCQANTSEGAYLAREYFNASTLYGPLSEVM